MKMNRKRSFVAAAAFSVISIMPHPAFASCTKTGEIVYYGVGTPNALVYLRTSALSSILWFCQTSVDRIQQAASIAVVGRTHVQLTGDIAECPSQAAGGYIGQCTAVRLNP